ncbi:DUF1534 domain-containing protein [Pseudomonas syringae]|uniref:DUF1534 domain-containing protein n=1 Tax=Pseudomonas syringae TaxID=317 RepID=A0A9Q4A643_PSESX|nr:DUF1534 domain-containing protein [Pseudomonas syringae]MCF5472773.1 DUF1534 domain-containing protein [Pseudomonas syringae]MCF5481371.1 DUF1534 domain-containing protein [Pseudomonas syringae]MCF5486816.1 DUF1534 domain-containing protein [Pseudomonas syringae]MCF5492686.1 DUF1534 domain-containing protein [Pseudomonas syringae]
MCITVSAEHGYDSYGLSFLTLQRGNALGDAPRHKSVPRQIRRVMLYTFLYS